MLTVSYPKRVKCICGFIYRDEAKYVKALDWMRKRIGPTDSQSNALCFDYTDYYIEEMGSPLYRRFISFSRLIRPESIVQIKHTCIRIEKRLAARGKRTVNIDPGYLTEANLILTTTKDFSHRIYLGKGIWAEVTLAYTKDGFTPFDWTYPDFKSAAYQEILLAIRQQYRMQLKK